MSETHRKLAKPSLVQLRKSVKSCSGLYTNVDSVYREHQHQLPSHCVYSLRLSYQD